MQAGIGVRSDPHRTPHHGWASRSCAVADLRWAGRSRCTVQCSGADRVASGARLAHADRAAGQACRQLLELKSGRANVTLQKIACDLSVRWPAGADGRWGVSVRHAPITLLQIRLSQASARWQGFVAAHAQMGLHINSGPWPRPHAPHAHVASRPVVKPRARKTWTYSREPYSRGRISARIQSTSSVAPVAHQRLGNSASRGAAA